MVFKPQETQRRSTVSRTSRKMFVLDMQKGPDPDVYEFIKARAEVLGLSATELCRQMLRHCVEDMKAQG